MVPITGQPHVSVARPPEARQCLFLLIRSMEGWDPDQQPEASNCCSKYVQSLPLTKDDLAAAPSVQLYPTALSLPVRIGRAFHPRLSGFPLPIGWFSWIPLGVTVSNKRLISTGQLRCEGKFWLSHC